MFIAFVEIAVHDDVYNDIAKKVNKNLAEDYM